MLNKLFNIFKKKPAKENLTETKREAFIKVYYKGIEEEKSKQLTALNQTSKALQEINYAAAQLSTHLYEHMNNEHYTYAEQLLTKIDKLSRG